jgi:hypothetical protein
LFEVHFFVAESEDESAGFCCYFDVFFDGAFEYSEDMRPLVRVKRERDIDSGWS